MMQGPQLEEVIDLVARRANATQGMSFGGDLGQRNRAQQAMGLLDDDDPIGLPLKHHRLVVEVHGDTEAWNERDLAEALRWLLDESLRVDTSNLIETAENRIRLESLGWNDRAMERMSLSRQRYLIEHQVRGELFTLDHSGKLRPCEGSNVWMLRVPS